MTIPAILHTIPGARVLNQLNVPTSDGQPDENARMNCVPTSLAEGLAILTRKQYLPDQMKDAVYGQGYKGGQAASSYVAYCAKQDVLLKAVNGSQQTLIQTIHAEVAANHPVVITMPSQWGTAPVDPVHPSGSTHVGLAIGVGPGQIRVMNPWGGFWQDQSDAWWQARLCYGQVWVMSAINVAATHIPAGWADDGKTLTAPNGIQVVMGFRDYILTNSHGWFPYNVPLEAAIPEAHGTSQLFLQSVLRWTQETGVVYHDAGAELQALRQQYEKTNVTYTALVNAARGIEPSVSALEKLLP